MKTSRPRYRKFIDSLAASIVVIALGLGTPAATQDGNAQSAATQKGDAQPDGASESQWEIARPDYEWSFPRDHAAHPNYRTEWWYFTGHLESVEAPQRRFGYQFTFFRVGLSPQLSSLDSAWSSSHLLMGHASLTEIDSGNHRFSEVLYRQSPLLADFLWTDSLSVLFANEPDRFDPIPLAWSRGPAGTEDLWELDWNGNAFDFRMSDERQGFGFSLETQPEKPRIFQGPDGYSKKGREESAASLYYSFTRLATEGTLVVDGETIRVRGQSWMDKEFGSNQLSASQVGWDWFSLQLEDGRDIMLYLLRRADGTFDFQRGTIVSPDGSARYLADDWSIEMHEYWTSPETGSRYPNRWTLHVEGEQLEVKPFHSSQENVALKSGGLRYWEGAVEVTSPSGDRLGRGYVELTGYGQGNRPPL